MRFYIILITIGVIFLIVTYLIFWVTKRFRSTKARSNSEENVKDHGERTEDLIENICKKMFFSDFTVRNPKYKKEDGNEKEAADFLVPFKDTLLAFQVKSKEEVKNADQKSAIDYGRIQKRVDKSIYQLKTIKRVVKDNRFDSLKTVRGLEIPFDCSKAKKIIGVVIIDLVGEERFPRDKRTTIFAGFLTKFGIPVHIFMRDDFEAISHELNTMPDFLQYLETRETLWTRSILSTMTDELDYLALYKTKVPLIEDLMSGKADHVFIDSGIWQSYQKEKETIKKRDKARFPSLIIDDVIQWLHSSLGFQIKDFDIEDLKSSFPQGTIDNYVASITELASLSRLERTVIGKKFLEKMKKADKCGQGYGAVIDRKKKLGIVVLSSNLSRKERLERLYTLCAITFCKHKLTKVIGISSEPLKAKARSYDVVVLNDVTFTNADELAKGADNMFGKESNFHYDEYNID